MVANNFKSCPIVSDIITEGGKQYVKIQTINGATRKVRWYAENNNEKPKISKTSAFDLETPSLPNAKDVLGFGEKGYITVFKGNTEATKDWFSLNGKYSKHFGWYFPSNKEITTLPFNIEPIKINWDEVSVNNNLISDAKIQEVIDSKIYGEKSSQYLGKIGEKVEALVTINYIKDIDNGFGTSYFHIMTDNNGNVLTWTSNTKKLNLGEKYRIVGTVKDYKKYHNEKQTVLTYCKAYFPTETI